MFPRNPNSRLETNGQSHENRDSQVGKTNDPVQRKRAGPEFDVGLGSSPVGHKQERGDGKTPVGTYVVDRRNPNSQFHLSLGLSYPNEIDQVVANVRGIDPGDNIFIHGEPNNFRRRPGRDWTEGCIAVTNSEIELIYRVVDVGTPVHIYH